MNKTDIEWAQNPDGSQGYTLNSKTGCTNHTPEGICLGGLFPCYAFKVADGRLKPLYLANVNLAGFEGWRNIQISTRYSDEGLLIGNPPEKAGFVLDTLPLECNKPFYPRFWPDRLKAVGLTGGTKRPHSYGNLKYFKDHKPKGIFLDDMSDWMLDCWPREWTEAELQMMRDCPWHRFYTLTKQPQNLHQFSPFPDNAWVGVTATNNNALQHGLAYLPCLEARIKYISFEPLLSQIIFPTAIDQVDWLIIGACTGFKTDLLAMCQNWHIKGISTEDLKLMPWGKKWTAQPRIEWVREIVEAADKAGIPVFLKDNLGPMLPREVPTFYTLLEPWNDIDPKPVLRQEMPNCPK